jgi:hypothetical protein
MFFTLASLAFGLSAAVIRFNRVPAFLVAFLRRMLFIPTINVYDDFRFFDIAGSSESAQLFFNKVIEFFGPKFDTAKDQSSDTEVTLLGGIVDMRAIADYLVTLKPTDTKEDAMVAGTRVFLTNRRMSSGEAPSLRGRILNWASYIAGRLGIGCLDRLTDKRTRFTMTTISRENSFSASTWFLASASKSSTDLFPSLRQGQHSERTPMRPSASTMVYQS